jgi:RNA polymerase sigma-70 factor, ECF subfamily
MGAGDRLVDTAVDTAIDALVRTSYGRLVALLTVRTRDLAAAEDALSEALLAALRTWPERGVPDAPEAWMLTAARRALIGAHRRGDTAARAAPALAMLSEELAEAPGTAFPDRRLELLFACAHPALAPDVRAPLMLQAVLGLDAVRIADAFLVKPAALGQQLVRAKRRLVDTGIPYRVPDRHELPERLGFVLDAIYVAYGTGWDDAAGLDPKRADLTAEAIHLATLLAELLPQEAEAHGLAALLLHSDARATARRDPAGRFVPLAEQDIGTWSRERIERAERHLARGFALGVVGPYQLQAAIQSVHNRRAVTGRTDWTAISALYDGLHRLAPSTGGGVARAAAHLQASGPVAAREALAELDERALERYQPYWVTLAEIALAAGDHTAAAVAMERAIELTSDPGVVAHLRTRLVAGRDR